MDLISVIKAEQLNARKQRDVAKASALTTLIGEAEMIGKNAGRIVTDSEVTALIQKFVKNIDITLQSLHVNKASNDAVARFESEKALYESFLPKQLTENELRVVIGEIVAAAGGPVNVGAVMAVLKDQYAGQYDGKLASAIVKEKLQ